jgi:hypothetical protein
VQLELELGLEQEQEPGPLERVLAQLEHEQAQAHQRGANDRAAMEPLVPERAKSGRL